MQATIMVQPTRARTAVNLQWRKHASGNVAPESFFTIYGKNKFSLEQVAEIAEAWLVWKQTAESRGVPLSLDLFYKGTVDPMLERNDGTESV